jgi:integrase
VLTDQELIIFALKDAGRIIAEHLEPGRARDPEETITRLRASELCSLRWEHVDLAHGRLHVSRVKNGMASVHPLTGRSFGRCVDCSGSRSRDE